MFDIRQFVLSLTSFLLLWHGDSSAPRQQVAHGNKSVAIVGAGSAGLAVLRALVDLQIELHDDLDIVLYEQRRDVGGIWLPDPELVHPPVLPETPLYPLLHTNTPMPTMTYPGFPFPPGTPMFSSHEYVLKYHRDYALQYNLLPYILFNHTVLSASWVGTSEEGRWDIVVEDGSGRKTRRSFDHLVVASGHNHYPHILTFPGQDAWLRRRNGTHGRRREILHSIFFRDPERYANQTVVVVGAGASGRDAASQVALYARKVYHSVRTVDDPASGPVEVKPEIAHFSPEAIVFADGSRALDVDVVILGTGYDLRVPFLETTGEIAVKPQSHRRDHGLTTNLRYLFPLHQHIFSLSASYPTNALAFIGLPILISNCPSDVAQSVYAARVIANASLLGPREQLLAALDVREDELRSRGYDPYYIGHRMVLHGSSFDYQDELIENLKAQGAIPDDGTKYVESWRREARDYQYVKRGWKRVEELGQEREWLRGVETEAEWADLMKRLDEWEKEWEMRQGLVFPKETTVF
ncbi:hypothetical protein L210DRAFT_3389535 [Boletus edulis BED1]|uniref:FAD/NAD(P)-binding domain-containing protein n=1 Tax=Boletus edulis BED1 TaxID=1328754 RepID=A0AAD4GKQ6_BOLED|nr:hypothetical protein L210DRAFT_3389535 [Boletus edulis BED1]